MVAAPLLGFFNMNSEQSLDIPLGEDNYIETDYRVWTLVGSDTDSL